MVIPIHDENPVRRRPVVTWVLVALNVALFLVEPVPKTSFSGSADTFQGACQEQQFFEHYGAIPAEMTRNRQVPLPPTVLSTDAGDLTCPRATFTKLPALSVLTAMFLHGGWLHLLGNMLFFVIFGNNVEDRLGRFRFLAFYLICGYGAAYAFAFVSPDSTQPLIGASGAIAGVLGAYLVMFPRARVTALVPFLLFLPFRMPAWLVLGFWFVLQWIYSAGDAVAQGTDVAYFAHVAGFILGMLLILVMLPRGRRAPA